MVHQFVQALEKKQELRSHHRMRLMMKNKMNSICQQMIMKKFNMSVTGNLKKKEPFGMDKVCGVSY